MDRRLFRWLALSWLGGAEQVAEDALQAILDRGGLSRDELASRMGGYSEEGRDRRLMLLAMGRDQAPGRLHYDHADDRLYADMDLFHHAPLYAHQERSMRDVAKELGGELRVNPAWRFWKPITVHSQGGCRMDDVRSRGVTDPNGKVWGQDNLYVLDGAILCAAVGVNPSATIAALAERNIDVFLKNHREGVADHGVHGPEGEGQRPLRDAQGQMGVHSTGSA